MLFVGYIWSKYLFLELRMVNFGKFLDRKVLEPSIFGSFDGLTSLLGVLIPLLGYLYRDPRIIFATCLCLAVSSAVSMGLGEYLSEDGGQRIRDSLYMGLFTGLGCILPAVPFAFIGGFPALSVSVGVYLLSICGISYMKSVSVGWRRAVTGTFLVSGIAVVCVVVTTLLFPVPIG